MSHPIIEGPVEILKIVTPGAYWIKCDACEGSCRTPASIRRKPNSNEYYYPQLGHKVFVQDEDGFFYRGTVRGRRYPPKSMFWKYIVQLTDTFQVKDFDQLDIYPTYGESSAACQSAHLVSLYHLLPQIPPASYGKSVNIDSAELEAFESAVVNWDRVSLVHLTQNHVQFSFDMFKLINGSIYGDLSTRPALISQTGTKCTFLTDYLHCEKYGVKISFQFEDAVGALMTNPLKNHAKLLVPFDPFGTTDFRPEQIEPVENTTEPPVPFDLTGLRIHDEDIDVHRSLSSKFYINVPYINAPNKEDVMVRYVTPDGNIILGTVKVLDIKYAEEVDKSIDDLMTLSAYDYKVRPNPELDYPDKLFEKLPPEDPEDWLLPNEHLLSYDFTEALQTFKAAGGTFEEQMLPYPFSTAVEKLIVQHLDALGVENLREWQKLCLPSLACRKNLVVVGPKSMGKLTMATVSALSWMMYVNPPEPDSIHPQLIIFASDFTRAEKLAGLCAQLADSRVIVSTSTFITETQRGEALNGCDILITTPSNWPKLICANIFDYSRLNFVIFDGFDRLHEIYSEDLLNVLEALDLYSSRRIQVVILSSTWSVIIERTYQEIMELSTLCIMDVVMSCLRLKLKPTVVFVEHDNWTADLTNILSGKSCNERILLCKDEEEGREIIRTTYLYMNEVVLFAHENLEKHEASNMVSEWDKNRDNLLICTDDCFKQLDWPEDIGFIISWMTNCWDTLSSRFMAFRRAFGFKKDLSRASAYLFCDRKKLEQLLLIKNISDHACFNGTLDEHLDIASILAEHGKRNAICPSIFMFGRCNDVPACPLRHVFLLNEDLEIPDVRQFLNVSILRVHNALKYSVRVKEIVSNYDHLGGRNASALISKLEDIETGLAKSYSEQCLPDAPKIGDMVGACIVRDGNQLLRRTSVKLTPDLGQSEFYSLSIVDYEEPDVLLPLTQLFVIPDIVANYPRDVVDLHITGLVPVDFKSDWQKDTFGFVTNVMTEIIEESDYLAGKVEMVSANRSVLVDTLFCFKELEQGQKKILSITGSEFCSLKDLLLESGYCTKNITHLASIVKRASSGSDVSPLRLSSAKKNGCRTDLPTHPIEAVVSSYDDPGLFYVQLVVESEKLIHFERELTSTLDRSRQKLSLINVDELCAVQHSGVWNRALIFDIIADRQNPAGSIQILFVDYGGTRLNVQPQELYRLPTEFVTVPYFSTQCELVGIKPFRDDGWHEQATAAFGSYVRNGDCRMEVVMVQFCGTKEIDVLETYSLKYLVIISEMNDPNHSINFHLARRGLVSFDPETKHLLKTIY